MSIDQSLLDDVDVAKGEIAWLRLYRWAPPCLSFGRNEPALDRYDRSLIESRGIDVVRRPTGGRAVWHEHEVTYAVAAPVEAFGCLEDCYLEIHQRLARALQALGLPAELAVKTRTPGVGAGACFAQPVGGEVIVRGRKVIGSAQVRQGNAFLQHGSILLDGSQDVIAQVSRHAAQPSNSTTLSAELGRPVSFEEVATAVIATWGSSLSGDQSSARPAVRPSASDPSWTWRR